MGRDLSTAKFTCVEDAAFLLFLARDKAEARRASPADRQVIAEQSPRGSALPSAGDLVKLAQRSDLFRMLKDKVLQHDGWDRPQGFARSGRKPSTGRFLNRPKPARAGDARLSIKALGGASSLPALTFISEKTAGQTTKPLPNHQIDLRPHPCLKQSRTDKRLSHDWDGIQSPSRIKRLRSLPSRRTGKVSAAEGPGACRVRVWTGAALCLAGVSSYVSCAAHYPSNGA